MALSEPVPPVNLTAKSLFVPMSCYASALKLALELALEVRLTSDEEIHRTQVEEIDAALVEIGEGRDPLQAVADRTPLVENEQARIWGMSLDFVPWRVRNWLPQTMRVTQREYDAIRQGKMGKVVTTRGVNAWVALIKHDFTRGFFVEVRFAEKTDA